MKKIFVLSICLVLLTGCSKLPFTDEAKAPTQEMVQDKTMKEYLHNLPDGYFAFYFPIGSKTSSRDNATKILDEENMYVELGTKNTVSGTVHWAMKEFTSKDGKKLLVISDLLEAEKTTQHFFVVAQNEAGEWNDETQTYFDGVMKQAAQMNIKQRVLDHYDDKQENEKLKRSRFIFSATSTDMIAGIGSVWTMELPLYTIAWDGEKFVIVDQVPTPVSTSTQQM